MCRLYCISTDMGSTIELRSTVSRCTAQAMADLKADYEGALAARLQAAAAAKDAAFALQQRAEAAEALLAQLRHENESLAGPLALVNPLLAIQIRVGSLKGLLATTWLSSSNS